MRFVSLFAGIGGLDLGLERAGHECIGQVEIDDYATRVLEKHWPTVPRIRDVRDFHGTEFGAFDMLVGGYPCQPFSVAGGRKGAQDERHLWPHVHRIIRNVRPRLVFLENVPGHLSLGFERVLGDLAESGYDAEWDCIPAAAVGAPHRRDRVFILAYANQSRPGAGESIEFSEAVRDGDRHDSESEGRWRQQQSWLGSSGQVAYLSSQSGDGSTHHTGERVERGPQSELGNDCRQENVAYADSTQCKRNCSTVRTPQEHTNASSTSWWALEPNVGRMADGVPARVDRLRTLGNAVVPQVAEYIGTLIKESEHALPS